MSAKTTPPSSTPDLPKTTPLQAAAIPALCALDEQYLEEHLANFSTSNAHTRVALIPDAHTIQWLHAREEFVASETLHRDPLVKGAIVSTDGEASGKRVWCIWTRTFGSKKSENVLHILRLVIEGKSDVVFSGDADTNGTEPADVAQASKEAVRKAAAVLRAAQFEAAEWEMGSVEIWNPTLLVMEAAKMLAPGGNVDLVDRQMSSVCCLMWYGDDEGQGVEGGVEWVGNEKFGWC